MAGTGPAIRASLRRAPFRRCAGGPAWMPGTRPGMAVPEAGVGQGCPTSESGPQAGILLRSTRGGMEAPSSSLVTFFFTSSFPFSTWEM